MCRAASTSDARSRMRGASARAIANGVVAAGTVSVIMESTAHPARPAGTPSRRHGIDHEALVEGREHLVDGGARPHLPERRVLEPPPAVDESLPRLLPLLPRPRRT